MNTTTSSGTRADISVRNDTATMTCGQCGHTFRPVGRRQWCSDACRQAAWRQRNSTPRPAVVLAAKPLKADTVYECPNCETRYLAQQYCPDCHTFCRNIGRGGSCPHCDEPVTIADLSRSAAGR